MSRAFVHAFVFFLLLSRAFAQSPLADAIRAAEAERAAYESESLRLVQVRETMLDSLRAEFLQELAKAEDAERGAAVAAADVEALAYATELAERRADVLSEEAATWSELLARRGAEFGRAATTPVDAGIVDAATAAAIERRRRAGEVHFEAGELRVGRLQRFLPVGGDRALAAAFGRDPQGPFDLSGFDALTAKLSAGGSPDWFPCDPSSKFRPVAAGDAGFGAWVKAGGPIVIVILLLGGLAACSALWRGVALWRTNAGEPAARDRADIWLGPSAERSSDPEAALDRLATRAEATFLKGQTFLGVVVAVAPLLGLLGTVTGMITTFDALTRTGGGEIGGLSAGISEALITTEAGLIAAIPLLLLHALIGARARRLIDATLDAGGLVLSLSGGRSEVRS